MSVTARGTGSRMVVVHGVGALEPGLGRLFVVIGVFDGLHRGHQYLLEELRRHAAAHDAKPAVITFDHHPDEVLTGSAPPLLCDPDERLQRLEAAGVAVTVIQTFDVALRMTRYDEFIRGITDRVDLAGIMMTPESAFGFQREGTPETVAALGGRLGYEVVVIPPFRFEGRPVSSSAVRAAIQAGDLELAATLLGRPVSVAGVVERDADRAWQLRFALPVALPPGGDYEAELDGEAHPGRPVVARVLDGRVRVAGELEPVGGRRARLTFVRTARGA